MYTTSSTDKDPMVFTVISMLDSTKATRRLNMDTMVNFEPTCNC